MGPNVPKCTESQCHSLVSTVTLVGFRLEGCECIIRKAIIQCDTDLTRI